MIKQHDDTLWKCPHLLGLFVLCLILARPTLALGLTAASDDQGLWLLIPEPDRPDTFTVLHHGLVDPPERMNMVQTLNGDIRPHSISARDHVLWLIHAHGQVQTIHAKPYILDDIQEYHSQTEPSLPRGAAVRASAVTAQGLWALVRIEDRAVLASLQQTDETRTQPDTTSDAAKRRRNIALGLPPDFDIDTEPESVKSPDTTTKPSTDNDAPDGQSDDKPNATPTVDTANHANADTQTEQPSPGDPTDKPTPVALPVDRLLHLSGGRWQVHPLPEDWPHGARAYLVTEGKSARFPTLIAIGSNTAGHDRASLDVYQAQAQPQSPDWQHQTYAIDRVNDTGRLSFTSAESQLMAAVIKPDGNGVSAELSVLRGGKTLAVGRMTLPGVAPNHAALLGSSSAVILIGRSADALNASPESIDFLTAVWTRMDVRGRTLLEPTDLIVDMPSPMDEAAQYMMLVFIAVLVAMLMLAFRRRDADWNKLELPEDRIVADLPRRAVAAAIDMAPGLVGSMLYFHIWFNELMLRWPGNAVAHTLSQMVPGSIVIAVFVTHTTLSELCFARTLGKAIIGLRTTTLTGARPKSWQLLVRGLLKVLDLIPGAWLLLLLPVISPHRQRLGDLVARTVVTRKAPPPLEKSGDDKPGQ